MQSYATAKGQIIIPVSLRRKYGIKEGTLIQIEADEKTGTIILRPITREFIRQLGGKHRGKGLLKTLMDQKKRAGEA